jgi:hypothetical protein
MITKEMEKLFSDLVRIGLFLPNKDGVKAFAHLLGQITMKGQPKLYGPKTVLKTKKQMKKKYNKKKGQYEILPRT